MKNVQYKYLILLLLLLLLLLEFITYWREGLQQVAIQPQLLKT